jgi:excisionase family DNA binding protein
MATNLLRPAEVGQRLGLSKATVYRLIAARELTTVHVGNRRATRIEESEVDAYIARNRRAQDMPA